MWSVKIVLTPQPSLCTQTCLLEKIANLGAKLIRVNQNVFILNFPSPYMRWCSVMGCHQIQISCQIFILQPHDLWYLRTRVHWNILSLLVWNISWKIRWLLRMMLCQDWDERQEIILRWDHLTQQHVMSSAKNISNKQIKIKILYCEDLCLVYVDKKRWWEETLRKHLIEAVKTSEMKHQRRSVMMMKLEKQDLRRDQLLLSISEPRVKRRQQIYPAK